MKFTKPKRFGVLIATGIISLLMIIMMCLPCTILSVFNSSNSINIKISAFELIEATNMSKEETAKRMAKMEGKYIKSMADGKTEIQATEIAYSSDPAAYVANGIIQQDELDKLREEAISAGMTAPDVSIGIEVIVVKLFAGICIAILILSILIFLMTIARIFGIMNKLFFGFSLGFSITAFVISLPALLFSFLWWSKTENGAGIQCGMSVELCIAILAALTTMILVCVSKGKNKAIVTKQ